MDFTIGQIIYVFSDEKQVVLPAIIYEEMLHKTMEGTKKSYKVAVGSPSKRKVLNLSEINGEVFCSLDEIKNILLERLVSYVDNLCAETKGKEQQWYGIVQDDNSGSSTLKDSNGKIDPGSVLDELSAQEGSSNQPHQPNIVHINGDFVESTAPNKRGRKKMPSTSRDELQNSLAEPGLLDR